MVHKEYRSSDSRSHTSAVNKSLRFGGRRELMGFRTSSGEVCELPEHIKAHVKIYTGTQCPSLALTFHEDQTDQAITFVIQPDMISNVDEFGLRVRSPIDLLKYKEIPFGCDKLLNAASTSTLFMIDLNFKDAQKNWIGLNPVYVHQNILHPKKQPLRWLAQCDGVQLFLKSPILHPEDIQPMHSFFLYMRTCWWLCKTQGYFWFYQSQFPNQSLSDPSWDFDNTVAPRWMATKWLVGSGLEDEPVTEAIQWSSFPVVTHWPRDPKYAAFAHNLGISRERSHTYDRLIQTISPKGDRVEFRPTFFIDPNARESDKQVTYFVALACFGHELDSLWPELETRVKLEVHGSGFTRPLNFVGTVCEDLLETGCPICLAVTGAYHDELLLDSEELDESDESEKGLRAILHFLDDPTSAARGAVVVNQLFRGHPSRKTGVDLQNLCFGAPVPDQQPAIKNDLSNEILARLGKCSPPPNQTQLRLIHTFLTSPSATMLLQGAPGTGKTYITALVIISCLLLGYKVLVTSPSREIVRVAYDVLKQHISDAEALDSEIVLFKGAYTTLDRFADLDTAQIWTTLDNFDHNSITMAESTCVFGDTESVGVVGEPKQTLSVAKGGVGSAETTEFITTGLFEEEPGLQPHSHVHRFIHVQDDYSGKLEAMVDSAVANSDGQSAFQKHAVDYASVRTKICGRDWSTTAEQLSMTRTFAEAEQALHEDYLGKHVKVVFATCSTSYHPLLRQHFKPDVIITEEAAMGTSTDVFTPLAAFKNSVKMVFHTGDCRRTRPPVFGRDSNEMYQEMSLSHFRKQMEDSTGKWTKADLNRQFRMHIHIRDWPALQFYSPGKVKLLASAPGVSGQDPALQLTLKEVFQKLGPAWNGRFRIGVDVSGKGSTSTVWGNTKSLYNKMEADMTLKLARYLVAYVPTTPGARRIVPKDIYMISPYEGQCLHMKKLLTEANFEFDCELVDRVLTTEAMVGREARIVFVMHTRNVHNKPATLGFASSKEIMNINATRARNLLVWVGNWKGWCTAVCEHNPAMMRTPENVVMKSFVQHYLHTHQDIISSEDIETAFSPDGVTPTVSKFHEAMRVLRTKRKEMSTTEGAELGRKKKKKKNKAN